MKHRPNTFVALVVLLMAFAMRALPLTRESLWRDEVDTIRFAFAPAAELLANFARAGLNGPLYLAAVRVWLTLGGDGEFALRAFSALCGVVGVALIVTLARGLFGARAGWVAGAMMALSPALIWYSGEGKMYALVVALAALALFALRRATATDAARWWVAFVAAVSVGYFAHLLFALLVPVALACWWLWRRELKGAALRRAVASFALLTLPYVPLAIWQAPLLWAGADTGHALYAPGVAALSLAFNWSLGLSSRLALDVDWRIVAVAIAAYAALVVVAVRRLRARAVAMLVWMALPPALAYVISLRAPVFEPRYVLWCAPALFVLAGAACPAHSRAASPKMMAYLAAVCGLLAFAMLGNVSQWLHPLRPDVRGAAAFLAQRARPGDAVVFQMPYARFGFEHYWRARPPAGVALIEGPFTNRDLASGEAAFVLDVGAAKRVWLVEAEAELWDARGLTRAWLAERASKLDEGQFRGVRLTLFDSPLRAKTFLPALGQ